MTRGGKREGAGRPAGGTNKKKCAYWFDIDVLEFLDAEKNRRGSTVSKLIHEALRDYFGISEKGTEWELGTWYRVYKTYRNGRSPVDYFEVPKYSKKDYVEECARTWAEHTAGGSNYGWTVHWTRVKRPPQWWLHGKIMGIYEAIEGHKKILEQYLLMYNG